MPLDVCSHFELKVQGSFGGGLEELGKLSLVIAGLVTGSCLL